MPGNTIGKGVVEVTYDKGQAEKSARDAILPGLNRVAGDMLGVFAGKKIFDFAKQGFAELGEAQKVAALTTSTLKATGGAANVTSEQVSGLATSLSDLSGKDDELIQSGENLLLTFKAVANQTGEGNDIFNQATKAALDLSTAGFGSMESASVMLGKALQDPIKGVTALQRVGVSLTQAQKDQVAAFVESGDVLSAQKVILGEVEAQVGGAAEAYGQTLPGQLERANNAMDEAKAAMVGGLAPALSLGADLAVSLSEKFTELPEPMQQVIGATALVGGGIGALARPVGDTIKLFQLMKPAAEAAAAAETEMAVASDTAAVSSGRLAAVGLTAGSAIPLLAAAGGIAVGVYSALDDALSTAEAGTAAYTAAIEKNTGALSQNVDEVTANELSNNAAAQAAREVGISYESMFTAVREGTDNWGEYARQLDQAKASEALHQESVFSVSDALRSAGAEGTEFGRQLLVATDAGKLNADQVHALVKEMEGLHNGFTGATEAAGGHKEALDAATGATDNLNASLEDEEAALAAAAEATKNLHDVMHAAIDPLFAMQKAVADNAAAQADLNEKQADGKTTEAELEEAHLKVAQSALGVYDAQVDLTAAMDAGKVSIDGAKIQLAQWVAQGLLTQESANQVADALQRDIDKANELDGKNVNINVNTVYSSQGEGVSAGGGKIFAASGYAGTISRPTDFTIGEAGPEDVLIVPHSQGGIGSGMFAPGMNSSVTVVVHVGTAIGSDLRRAGEELAEPVRRALLKKSGRNPAGVIGLL